MSHHFFKAATLLLATVTLAPRMALAQLQVSGDVTLDDGKKVHFVRLSRDKDDVGGNLDQVYSKFLSTKPNMSYGTNVTENFGEHRERLAKFNFEDVVRIDFMGWGWRGGEVATEIYICCL